MLIRIILIKISLLLSTVTWANGSAFSSEHRNGELVEVKKDQSIKLEAVFKDKVVISLDGLRMVYTVGKRGKYGIVFLSSNLQGALMHRNNAYTWLDVSPELQAYHGTHLTPALASQYDVDLNNKKSKAVAKNKRKAQEVQLTQEQKEIREALAKELKKDKSWLGKSATFNSLYENQI